MIFVLVAVAVIGVVVLRGRSRAAVVVPDFGPVGWVGGTRWRVVRPLGRAENRRLIRHPAFLAGVAITPWMIIASIAQEDAWWRISPASPSFSWW
jgi:hypothetical protein